MTVNGGGTPADKELFAEMARFVEELSRAGVLLATGSLDAGTHRHAALRSWPGSWAGTSARTGA
jgi:hypothetical protein